MMLLMRTGLVSFGQGMYYCLGAYAAGALDTSSRLITDVALVLLAVGARRAASSRSCSASCSRATAASSSRC